MFDNDKRWGPSDDARITQLSRTPHSGVDLYEAETRFCKKQYTNPIFEQESTRLVLL
jgi:hypothetical protein